MKSGRNSTWPAIRLLRHRVGGPVAGVSPAGGESAVPAEAGPVAGTPTRPSRLTSWIASALVGRVVSALVPLLLVPVVLSDIGADLYGLWMAVVAVTGMAAFADLGLGNGLLTRLAPCYASGDTTQARRYVSSAYAMVSAIALTGCVLLWLVSDAVPWRALFNVSQSAPLDDVRAISLVGLTAFLLNVPLSLIGRVQYAWQMGVRSNIWQAVGSAVSLPLTIGAVQADFSAPWVVAAAVSGPVLANVVNTCWAFARELRPLRPGLTALDPDAVRELLRIGGLFGVVTILMTLADNADNLIIAHTRGLADVTAYAVPAKLFTQLGMIVVLINQPFWPAHGTALALGRVTWVRRTARRMTLISVAVVLIPATALVACGERLFVAWLSAPYGDRWLLLGLAAWWLTMAAVSPVFMVQNAAGVIGPQLVGYVGYLVLSVIGKWCAARWLGIAAVPYVATICFLLTAAPAAIHGYRRTLARAARAGEIREVRRVGVPS